LCGSNSMLHTVLVDQAAQLLGVSRRTVYYRIRDGKLRTIRTRCGSQRVLMESIIELLSATGARDANASDPASYGRY
jgi:excisionase family DNA binding protein